MITTATYLTTLGDVFDEHNLERIFVSIDFDGYLDYTLGQHSNGTGEILYPALSDEESDGIEEALRAWCRSLGSYSALTGAIYRTPGYDTVFTFHGEVTRTVTTDDMSLSEAQREALVLKLASNNSKIELAEWAINLMSPAEKEDTYMLLVGEQENE